jgi:hypothetical protein
MSEGPTSKRVVALPTAKVIGPLQDRIRALAKETKNIALSRHAEDRMWERDISAMEVFEVLRLGMIDGAPWVEPESAEQACKVVLRKKGSRTIGVVTIILAADGLLVKTVEWED